MRGAYNIVRISSEQFRLSGKWIYTSKVKISSVTFKLAIILLKILGQLLLWFREKDVGRAWLLFLRQLVGSADISGKGLSCESWILVDHFSQTFQNSDNFKFYDIVRTQFLALDDHLESYRLLSWPVITRYPLAPPTTEVVSYFSRNTYHAKTHDFMAMIKRIWYLMLSI